jgi:Uma2 family endonuclease
MALTLAKWTLDEYHRMIAAGMLSERHVELLKQKIVEMPPEGPSHASGSTSTREYLSDLLGKRVLIRDAKPITLPTVGSEPEPDIAVVARQDNFYQRRHPYPADIFLLIEFSDSSLQKDLEEKRDIYAEAEILEYWVVNLRDLKVIVFRASVAGVYQVRQELVGGEIYPIAFPDVAVSIQQLLG